MKRYYGESRKTLLAASQESIDDEKENQYYVKLAEKVKKYGRKKEVIRRLFYEGQNDRMNAVIYDPDKYANEQEQNCYTTGFFENGSRFLSANIDKLPENLLKAIGCSDYYSNVYQSDFYKSKETKKIIDIITSNPFYKEGYLSAFDYNTKPEEYLKSNRIKGNR